MSALSSAAPVQDPQVIRIVQGVSEAQGQLRALSEQITETAHRREAIVKRINQAHPNEVDGLRAHLLELDAVSADLQSKFSDLVAKIAEAEAQKTLAQMVVPPPPMFPEPNRPFGIHPDAITAAFIILTVGLVVPLSIGIARRLWRRPQPAAPAPRDAETVSKARLDRLEQAVDTIAIEIERISEGQRFVTKVLTERPVTVRPSANEAAGPVALGESAPLLALGAGPIEPIRVAERQAVKQSITPH